MLDDLDVMIIDTGAGIGEKTQTFLDVADDIIYHLSHEYDIDLESESDLERAIESFESLPKEKQQKITDIIENAIELNYESFTIDWWKG